MTRDEQVREAVRRAQSCSFMSSGYPRGAHIISKPDLDTLTTAATTPPEVEQEFQACRAELARVAERAARLEREVFRLEAQVARVMTDPDYCTTPPEVVEAWEWWESVQEPYKRHLPPEALERIATIGRYIRGGSE